MIPYRVESEGPSAPRPTADVDNSASNDHGSHKQRSVAIDACIGSSPEASVHVRTINSTRRWSPEK